MGKSCRHQGPDLEVNGLPPKMAGFGRENSDKPLDLYRGPYFWIDPNRDHLLFCMFYADGKQTR